MHHAISDEALDQLFRSARSQTKWQDKPVSATIIEAVYDLLRWGPTIANCSPARFVFVTTQEAKERLKPHLTAGNVATVMSAPVTAIIGYDLHFHEKLQRLFPHADAGAKSWYFGNHPSIETTALRNGTLQGAYFMLAARALGLDVAPMSGFNNDGVDKEFFPDGHVKSNFICSIGTGDPTGIGARNPRLPFDEACRIV